MHQHLKPARLTAALPDDQGPVTVAANGRDF